MSHENAIVYTLGACLSRYQLKAHYKKSAAAHTFARLLNLLEDGGGAAPDGTGGSHDHDSVKGKVSKV